MSAIFSHMSEKCSVAICHMFIFLHFPICPMHFPICPRYNIYHNILAIFSHMSAIFSHMSAIFFFTNHQGWSSIYFYFLLNKNNLNTVFCTTEWFFHNTEWFFAPLGDFFIPLHWVNFSYHCTEWIFRTTALSEFFAPLWVIFPYHWVIFSYHYTKWIF
jgi:hypothetical protein